MTISLPLSIALARIVMNMRHGALPIIHQYFD